MSLLPSPAVRAATLALVAVFALPAAVSVLLGVPLVAAVLVGGVAIPAIVTTPALALVVLVVAEVTNLSEGVGSHAGLSVYLVSLALAVAALALGIRRGTARLVWSPIYIFAGFFVVTRALSIVAASHPPLAWLDTVEMAKALVFLVVVTSLTSSTNSHLTVAQSATLSAMLMAALSVVQQLVLHSGSSLYGLNITSALDPGTLIVRQSGPESDPNFWARSLLLFLPLGLSLLAIKASRGWRRRVLWSSVVGVISLGILLTGSRGGLLAVGFCLVVWLLFAGSAQRRLLLATPLIFAALFAVPGVGSRLGTLMELRNANTATVDPSLLGRLAAQGAALRMVSDHPMLGVGAANFRSVVVAAAREAGYALVIPLAPHDLYLQMAAEGGLFGLTGWLLFYGASVFVTARALVLARANGRSSAAAWLAVGVLASLAGWALASVFIHLSYLRVLLVVVALGAALDADLMRHTSAVLVINKRKQLADADIERTDRQPRGASAPISLRPFGRNRVITFTAALPTLVAMFVFVIGVSLLSLLGQLSRQLWESTASGLVAPANNSRSAGNAYQYDTLTRDFVIPTQAAVLGSPRFRTDAAVTTRLNRSDARDVSVSVTSSPQSALVYVTVRSPRQDVARRMAAATFDAGARFVNSVTPVFVMEPLISANETHEVQQTRWGKIAAVGAAAFAVDLFWRTLGRYRRRRSRTVAPPLNPVVHYAASGR